MALIIYINRREFVPGMSAIITIHILSSTSSITTEANITESLLVGTEDDVSSDDLISIIMEDD